MALYHLSLGYRLEGRLGDAFRVGSQAATVLEGLPPTEVVEEVLARLRDLGEIEPRASE